MVEEKPAGKTETWASFPVFTLGSQHLPAFIAQISLHSCDVFVASRCCPFDNVCVPGETQLSRTRLITRQVYVAGEHPASCGMTSTSAGVFSQRAATLGICCPRK